MKLLFLFSFIFPVFAFTNVFSQEVIALRSVPFDVPSKGVYIANVYDERPNKHLGTHKNLAGDKVKLHLDKGAEQAVKNFYETSLPQQAGQRPIVIKIKALNVQESKRRMNSFIARAARAHVELAFLEQRQGELVEIFSIQHNEDQVFGLYDKIGLYATHERRIRAALEYCMLAFLDNYQESEPDTLATHFNVPKGGYRVDPRLGQWFNLVTVKGMRSTYFEGYAISYTGFVDSKKGFIRPYETSFEVTWARPGVAADNGYRDMESFVFRPELYFFYKRIIQGVYVSLSANVPVGYELLENLDGGNSFNFVIGVGASQGLRIIPWERRGIVFGADFFQQIETSKVYRRDIGVELVLGVNF
ncbi:hypothetical protein [Tunicatimonas pelagia]|uniref:hypothetical protein n=1 Tax=Tunicatimonas pelagia TaxID=931531 RepID=UPI002664E630|nr:hypothetical protein [Tunicatimonas pelagia]WKN41692.1 hypothetical protein P0M28_21885 [Tunicatimonas pelagia]